MADRDSARPPTLGEDIQQTRPFRSRSQEAYLALLRSADESKRYATQVLEPAGVTLQQYNVLRILRGAGTRGLPTLSIGARMIERTPGVTRLVDRMERKGWVERARCTEDRRRVWCSITDAGLRLLESLDEPVTHIDEQLGIVFADDELVTLLKYLNRLRAHFAALAPPR